MEISTLMHWRRLVPGAMFAAILSPVLLPGLDKLVQSEVGQSSSADYLKAILIALFLVLGHIYDAADLRWKLKLRGGDRGTNQEILSKLKQSLVVAGASVSEIKDWEDSKKSWFRLLFCIVDGDPTLTVLSKRIYDAGFGWSSFIDAAIILLFGGLLGVVAAVVFGKPWLLFYYAGLVLLGLFARRSIAGQAAKHKNLCLEQQLHIQYFCRDQLIAEFRKGLSA